MANLREVEAYIATRRPGSVVGVDEAGRGPWAGPIVAAAVAVPTHGWEPHPLVRDSKKLQPHQMRQVYNHYVDDDRVVIGVGMMSAAVIDEIGIDRAQARAQAEAVRSTFYRLAYRPFVVVDGILPPALDPNEIEHMLCVPKADALIPAVGLASIVAKVTQLTAMEELDKRFPVYGFSRHHGYGTPEHRTALAVHGPCDAHRRSFKPVRTMKESDRMPAIEDLDLDDV